MLLFTTMTILNIAYLSGKELITISVKEDVTINEIKRFLTEDLLNKDLRIEDGTEREYRNVSLIYQDKVLDSNNTVLECGVVDESTLTFIDNIYDNFVTVWIVWREENWKGHEEGKHYYPKGLTIRKIKDSIIELGYITTEFRFIACDKYGDLSDPIDIMDVDDDCIIDNIIFNDTPSESSDEYDSDGELVKQRRKKISHIEVMIGDESKCYGYKKKISIITEKTEMINIKLVDTSGTHVTSIIVNKKHTISDIADFIQKEVLKDDRFHKYGSFYLLYLFYKDVLLKYYKTIADCNIETDSTIIYNLDERLLEKKELLLKIVVNADYTSLAWRFNNFYIPFNYGVKNTKMLIERKACNYYNYKINNFSFFDDDKLINNINIDDEDFIKDTLYITLDIEKLPELEECIYNIILIDD